VIRIETVVLLLLLIGLPFIGATLVYNWLNPTTFWERVAGFIISSVVFVALLSGVLALLIIGYSG